MLCSAESGGSYGLWERRFALVVGNTNSDHHLARFVLALMAANTAHGGKRCATCLVGGSSVKVLLAFKIIFGSAGALAKTQRVISEKC
jgi:hypothetical protein